MATIEQPKVALGVAERPYLVIDRVYLYLSTDISDPAQGIIAHSSSTEQALAGSERNTSTAISVAGASTGDALSGVAALTNGAVSIAGDSAGKALGKNYRRTRQALGTSANSVGKALHVTPKPETAKPE